MKFEALLSEASERLLTLQDLIQKEMVINYDVFARFRAFQNIFDKVLQGKLINFLKTSEKDNKD